MAQNITTIPSPRVPFLDSNNQISREWYRFLLNLFTLSGGGTTIVTVLNVHETENLNLATQALAHHQQPQRDVRQGDGISVTQDAGGFIVANIPDSSNSVLANRSLAQHQQQAMNQVDYDQSVMAMKVLLNHGQQLNFQPQDSQNIIAIKTFLHQQQQDYNVASDQTILASRIFGSGG